MKEKEREQGRVHQKQKASKRASEKERGEGEYKQILYLKTIAEAHISGKSHQ